MKRVLCLIDSLGSGGAQRQMVGLAVLLKEKGYDVKVLTYYDLPFYQDELDKKGVEHECVKVGRGLLPRLIKIGKAIKLYMPDIVIAYLDTPCLIACLLKMFGTDWKLIVSERNTTQVLSKREKIKFRLYRYADSIVPNSYSQTDYISEHYPKLKNRCRTITNFVNLDFFCPPQKYLANDVIRIIGVGRTVKQKNIPILINAIKLVKDKGYRIRVDWYGSRFGSYEECVELIKSLELEQCFIFHDAYNPIVEKYHESDLFVLPSIYEGFPNVLCEAMACGLPVIASDVCDNGRIVEDTKNGYLFSSGNREMLAECIVKFISLSDAQRVAMRKKSREIAVEKFSSAVFISKYISVIGNQFSC